MAYEILVNTSCAVALPANKPQYTPGTVFKKALRSVRRLFKKSNRHQRFLNETIAAYDMDDYSSEEELENHENELKEAELQRH